MHEFICYNRNIVNSNQIYYILWLNLYSMFVWIVAWGWLKWQGVKLELINRFGKKELYQMCFNVTWFWFVCIFILLYNSFILNNPTRICNILCFFRLISTLFVQLCCLLYNNTRSSLHVISCSFHYHQAIQRLHYRKCET